MEKASIINVNGIDYELGGGGTSINTSIHFGEGNTVFIKCNRGELKESDKLVFARLVTNINRSEYRKTRKRADSRYRGWIVPLNPNRITLKLEFFSTIGDVEYWKVKVISTSYSNFNDYEAYRDSVGNTIQTRRAMSMKKRCGIAVVRGTTMITNFMHFTVAYDPNSGKYTTTCW